MSPVTGLAWLAGQFLSSVHMGMFSPVNEMKKVRKVGCSTQRQWEQVWLLWAI